MRVTFSEEYATAVSKRSLSPNALYYRVLGKCLCEGRRKRSGWDSALKGLGPEQSHIYSLHCSFEALWLAVNSHQTWSDPCARSVQTKGVTVTAQETKQFGTVVVFGFSWDKVTSEKSRKEGLIRIMGGKSLIWVSGTSTFHVRAFL